MTKRKITLAIITMLIMAALVVVPVLAGPGGASLVSATASGVVGNSLSRGEAISADGQYIAFGSFSTNFVPGDINAAVDIFRKNRITHAVELVSVSTGGDHGDSGSAEPSISSNGRFIAFTSYSSNFTSLVMNTVQNVYLRDMVNRTTTLVSVNPVETGTANGSSSNCTISDDGRYAAFQSDATDLVAGFTDVNGDPDIFLRDLQTGITSIISVDSSGTQANSENYSPVISGNGQFVTYYSNATNLVPGDTNTVSDIFRYDRVSHLTIRVSEDTSGIQANDTSMNPSISNDGQFVSFSSVADNLVTGDINGAYDVFVKYLPTGNLTLVSKDSSGTIGNNTSDYSSLSPDGRYISFMSQSDNLVPGDTNGATDVFVQDWVANRTTRVSTGAGGVQSNFNSTYNDVSANGRYTTFESSATNLSAADTNFLSDIFINDISINPINDPDDKSDPIIIPATGFTPAQVTDLAPQPAEKQYTGEGMILEMPALDIRESILDVPQINGDWDVSWLSDNIGYLQGTAFPTWNGNSVLTGHVYGANGKPGPFVNLESLKWGDQVIVRAWGQAYTYEVRTVDEYVNPKDTRVLTKHEELPWLTLVTCKGFDEKSNTYRWRTVVRAVQVSVK